MDFDSACPRKSKKDALLLMILWLPGNYDLMYIIFITDVSEMAPYLISRALLLTTSGPKSKVVDYKGYRMPFWTQSGLV